MNPWKPDQLRTLINQKLNMLSEKPGGVHLEKQNT